MWASAGLATATDWHEALDGALAQALAARQVDSQPIDYDQTIPTAAGAHSIAADRVSATDWVPAFAGVCGAGTACVAIFGGANEDE